MAWGDLVTKSAAALGAGLGIFNSWQGWRQRKVRLRVIPTTVEVPRQVSQNSDGTVIYQSFFSPGVAVVNLSAFSVTLEEVGYDLGGGERYPLSRIDAPGRYSSGGQVWIADKLPQRLETRTSLRLALWDKDEESLKGKRIRSAYARTACGTKAGARNGALRMMSDRLANGRTVMEPVEKAK